MDPANVAPTRRPRHHRFGGPGPAHKVILAKIHSDPKPEDLAFDTSTQGLKALKAGNGSDGGAQSDDQSRTRPCGQCRCSGNRGGRAGNS